VYISAGALTRRVLGIVVVSSKLGSDLGTLLVHELVADCIS
jgi:hypothetical protein